MATINSGAWGYYDVGTNSTKPVLPKKKEGPPEPKYTKEEYEAKVTELDRQVRLARDEIKIHLARLSQRDERLKEYATEIDKMDEQLRGAITAEQVRKSIEAYSKITGKVIKIGKEKPLEDFFNHLFFEHNQNREDLVP